jgi:hypothetical protein
LKPWRGEEKWEKEIDGGLLGHKRKGFVREKFGIKRKEERYFLFLSPPLFIRRNERRNRK